MTLQEQYKKETNLEAYEFDFLNNGYDNFKYVKWLETKLIEELTKQLTISDVRKSFCVQTGLECGFPCHSDCPLYEK